MTEEQKNKIAEITRDLLDRAGFSGEIKFSESTGESNSLTMLTIESDQDLGMLIGKNGQNLAALEHLVRVMTVRVMYGNDKQWPPVEAAAALPSFVLDINDYRKSKTNYLIEVARNVARRVVETRRAEALLPMTAYERRLVHTELAGYKEVQTESIGQEPRRRIVVKPLIG